MISVAILQLSLFLNDLIKLSEGEKTGEMVLLSFQNCKCLGFSVFVLFWLILDSYVCY